MSHVDSVEFLDDVMCIRKKIDLRLRSVRKEESLKCLLVFLEYPTIEKIMIFLVLAMKFFYRKMYASI